MGEGEVSLRSFQFSVRTCLRSFPCLERQNICGDTASMSIIVGRSSPAIDALAITLFDGQNTDGAKSFSVASYRMSPTVKQVPRNRFADMALRLPVQLAPHQRVATDFIWSRYKWSLR
jgi:hypothetical protein